MGNVIELRISKRSIRSVNGMLGRLGRIPNMASDAMREWGGILATNMVTSAKDVGITRWRGKLFSGIQWRQAKNSRVGKLFMPYYGVQLDSLPTRRVEVKRGTLLDQWVRDPNKIGRPMKRITVHQYPFIRKGYDRSRPLLNTLLKQKIKIGRGMT